MNLYNVMTQADLWFDDHDGVTLIFAAMCVLLGIILHEFFRDWKAERMPIIIQVGKWYEVEFQKTKLSKKQNMAVKVVEIVRDASNQPIAFIVAGNGPAFVLVEENFMRAL